MKSLVLITILATLFRFYLLLEFTPHCCGSDEGVYHNLAKNMIETGEFVITSEQDRGQSTEKFYGAKPPLYPMFLASIYKVFGVNYQAAKIIQIFLSALTGLLIFHIAKIVFDKKVALTCLIVYSFFWETAFMSLNLISENLYWFLLSTLIFLLLKNTKFWLLQFTVVGILLGLLSLTRATALSLFIPISIWILWKKSILVSIVKIFLMLILFSLTLTPWFLRNYSLYNVFVPIYTDGGINFWMGNYPGSGGSYNIPKNDPEQNPILKSEGIYQEIERDNFYYNKAKQYIINNPLEAMDVAVLKMFKTFATYRAYILNTTSEHGEWFLSRPKSFGIDAFMEFLVSYQFAFVAVFFVISIALQLWQINKIAHNQIILIILFFWSLTFIGVAHYEPRYITQLYILMILLSGKLITRFFEIIKQEVAK